jgi:hypothetical protein
MSTEKPMAMAEPTRPKSTLIAMAVASLCSLNHLTTVLLITTQQISTPEPNRILPIVMYTTLVEASVVKVSPVASAVSTAPTAARNPKKRAESRIPNRSRNIPPRMITPNMFAQVVALMIWPNWVFENICRSSTMRGLMLEKKS